MNAALAGMNWWANVGFFSMRYWAMCRCEEWILKVGPGGPRFPTIENQERLAAEVPVRIEGSKELFEQYSQHKLHPSRGPAMGQVLVSRGDLSRPEKMRLTRANPGTALIVAEIDRCFRDGSNFTLLKQAEVLERWTLMVVKGEPGVYIYESPERRERFRLGHSKNLTQRRLGHVNSDFTLRAAYLTYGKKEASELEQELFVEIDQFVRWRKLADQAVGRQGALGFEPGIVASEFIHQILSSKFRSRIRRAVRPENLEHPDEIWNEHSS